MHVFPTSTRARLVGALVCLSAATLSACTGRNDGRRDSYGGASMGSGGPAPAGPSPGSARDTSTLAPASGAAAPAANSAPAGAAGPTSGTPATPATTGS